MKQYQKMLEDIKLKGTLKPAARANMPGTISLFGYQFRHNLADGFPALTTKKLYWKGVVVELLWFLRGDTNIKFLDDFGVRKMWHQDAYNYYKKIANVNDTEAHQIMQRVSIAKNTRTPNEEDIDFWSMFTFEEFCRKIKETPKEELPKYHNYTLGDCGYQYGKIWRNWETIDYWANGSKTMPFKNKTDQISTIIKGLKETPEGRRHILTAIDPAHDTNLALYWCHALAQWNCRPLTISERLDYFEKLSGDSYIDYKTDSEHMTDDELNNAMTADGIPKYYLDCQMYQRSADVFLGVPLNIASYALLTHIFAKITNMIPGEMIYTYGDVHIYEDHIDAVNLQLTREPKVLPKLNINKGAIEIVDWNKTDFDVLVKNLITHYQETFVLEDYNPDSTISANLSTGLQLQK